MIKQTLRQALTMMKQHKLFTGIYIAATALSVTMIMTTFAVLFIKFAPIYPEGNRDRTLTIKRISTTINDQADGEEKNEYQLSPKFAELIKKDSKYLDHLTCVDRGDRKIYVSATPDKKIKNNYRWGIYADEEFWKIFTYKFVDGRPFSKEDVENGNRVAVISQSTAMELFATYKVAGKQVYLNGEEMTIVGVVKDATSFTPETAAKVYIPLSLCKAGLWFDNSKMKLAGRYIIYATAKEARQRATLEKEIEEKVARYNSANTMCKYEIADHINNHVEQTFNNYGKDAFKNFAKEIALIVAAFLLIPAMCLGIMILSRMDNRMVEIGVRKTYGATTDSIVLQVLIENMLLTLIGGIAGLLTTIIIFYTAGGWVRFLYDSGGMLSDNIWFSSQYWTGDIDLSVIFSPSLYVTTLAVCMLINIISALMPVMMKLRHNIVYSLNRRK